MVRCWPIFTSKSWGVWHDSCNIFRKLCLFDGRVGWVALAVVCIIIILVVVVVLAVEGGCASSTWSGDFLILVARLLHLLLLVVVMASRAFTPKEQCRVHWYKDDDKRSHDNFMFDEWIDCVLCSFCFCFSVVTVCVVANKNTNNYYGSFPYRTYIL